MTEAPPMPSKPPKRPRRSRRATALLTFSLAVPVLIGAAAVGVYWTLTREAGTVWLLQHLPGLQIEAPQGALLGQFSARRLTYTLPGSKDQVIVEGLRGQGMDIAWSSAPQLWGLVHIDQLRADRIVLAFAPSQEASKAPTSVALPVGLKIDTLEVGRIETPALGAQPLRDLRASLDLSAERGALHRVKVTSLQWDRLGLAGEASLQTTGAMALKADLAINAAPSETLPDWRGHLKLEGPLRQLQAQAQLQAKGQSLLADAQLRPFEPWPIAGLKASAEKLDLSALLSDLPHTSLSGEAQLDAKSWTEAASLRLRLSNAAAGRWDQQRLPVQSITLEVQTRPDQLQNLQLKALDAVLGSSAAPGGRISGQGQIQLDQAGGTLTANLSGLRPAALDSRLAPLRLDGTVKLSGARAEPIQLDARLGGDWAPAGAKPTPLKVTVQAQLAGEQLTIAQAQLESGTARVALSGEASREGAGWRADVKAQMQDFDPRLLWAGTPNSAWQRGTHKLNANVQAQLRQSAADKTWPQGQAQVQVLPSQLSGVPLSGRLDYTRAGASEATVQAQLDLGENSLQGRATLPPLSGASALISAPINVQFDLKAPKLAALSPLLALLQPEAQLSGAAQGRVELKLNPTAQRWGGSSEGQLTVQNLQLLGPTKLSLGQGQLRWSADSRLDAPLSATADLQRLGIAGQQANKLTLDVQGTWAEHRLKFGLQGQIGAAAAKGSTPISGEALLALTGKLGSAPLQALQDGTPLGWTGRVANVLARPSNTALPAWFTARDLGLQVLGSRDSGPTSAVIAPGRAEVAGAAVRWSELQWLAARSGSERADVRAEMEIEPLAVAPLLKRWQPDFGWGGQLVVGGKVSVRTAPQLAVDIVLERSAGDLSVTDERGVQGLGLTDLRIGLTARDGLWQFTQGLAGTNLGSLGGAVTIHADPQALWPAPGARLEGVLQANVANLSTWGGWVPPGWRLGGTLTAGLQLAGTAGAPEIVGQANGSQISLRNPLQGVNITEGSFGLALNGATATLTQLTARGGDGLLTIDGQATLGAQPKAKLQMKADRFVLLNRVDRRLQASGQAQLDLGPQSLQLDGRFNVDEGLFDFSRADAPTLDDDVVVLRPDQALAEAQAAGTVTAKPSERKTRINVAIDLGQKLRIRGRGLDSRLRGELKLAQNDGALTLNGALKTVGGNYEAYGQKLDIERGEILFVGPFDNPRLDVLAVRPSNDDVRVGVSVTGTALNPRIKLFSDPDMTDTDKLSWLVLGRAPDGLGRADTALLQRAALALLSGEGESTSGKLIKNLGLDELSVSQADSETGDTRGTVVRLGKQLSRRWYVGYERGLNATTGSWQLIYRIAQRFTLRAQSGEDNALDLIWQWRWE